MYLLPVLYFTNTRTTTVELYIYVALRQSSTSIALKCIYLHRSRPGRVGVVLTFSEKLKQRSLRVLP